MLKQFIIILAFSLPIGARAELSDAEAKRIAVNMDSVISTAKNDLNQLIKEGARHEYPDLRASVQSALNNWPIQNLGNSAAFPYFSCADAARNFLQYGDAWSRNDTKRSWLEQVVQQFRDSESGCKSAIKKPDMSLKNIK
jgi:hypothetical protein